MSPGHTTTTTQTTPNIPSRQTLALSQLPTQHFHNYLPWHQHNHLSYPLGPLGVCSNWTPCVHKVTKAVTMATLPTCVRHTALIGFPGDQSFQQTVVTFMAVSCYVHKSRSCPVLPLCNMVTLLLWLTFNIYHYVCL